MHSHISNLIFLTTIFFVGSCRQDKIQLSGTCLKGSNSTGINWLYSSKHYLPWPAGKSYQISQASGDFSHSDEMLYSWDFLVGSSAGKLPGDKVIAAIGGTIAAIEKSITTSVSSYDPDKVPKEPMPLSNLVFIDWDIVDSREVMPGVKLQSQYRHFYSVSPHLRVGQRVERGTELGIAGCTGWCTGTHLHYEVRKFPGDRSIELQFVEKIPATHNVFVTSKNSSTTVLPAPDQRPPQNPPEEPIQDPAPDTFAFQALCDSRYSSKQSVCLNELDSSQDVTKKMLINCNEKTSTFCPGICIANTDSSSNDICGQATIFSGQPNGGASPNPINKNLESGANIANCD